MLNKNQTKIKLHERSETWAFPKASASGLAKVGAWKATVIDEAIKD